MYPIKTVDHILFNGYLNQQSLPSLTISDYVKEIRSRSPAINNKGSTRIITETFFGIIALISIFCLLGWLFSKFLEREKKKKDSN